MPEGGLSYIMNLAASSEPPRDRVDPSVVDSGFDWLPTLRSTSPTSSVDFAQWLTAYDECDTSNNHGASGVSEPQHRVDGTQYATLFQAPAHLPTMLVEHWFQQVCPMWSTFDSGVNYNRQLAWSSWGTSKSVFYTIQAMSAARLSVTTPYYRDIMLSLRSRAIAVIDEEIRSVRVSQSPKIKSDVVYALFTLGNSSHFSESTSPEYPWLDVARELLSAWKPASTSSEAPLHTYFCQALSYWEMLLAIGGLGSVPGKMEKKRRHYQKRMRQAMRLPESIVDDALSEPSPCDLKPRMLGTRPNSWSGASIEVIDIFGQVLALCHDAYCCSKTRHSLTSSMANRLLCNLSLAHELQRELLDTDFKSLIRMEELEGFETRTGDDKTPMTHLLQTAEAYRQAALLQLHLAFPDLQIERNTWSNFAEPSNQKVTYDTSQRTCRLTTLTLELVAILERIPIESGSKSIHLMLYLCAATGLRIDSFFESRQNYHVRDEPETVDIPFDSIWDSLAWETSGLSPNLTACPFPEIHHNQTNSLVDTTDTTVSQSTLEISRARDVVFTRLSSFQQTLPHRRIDETLQFVRAIWKEYDDQKSDYFSIAHWLDTMSQRGLTISLW